jgi:hypothetical protein
MAFNDQQISRMRAEWARTTAEERAASAQEMIFITLNQILKILEEDRRGRAPAQPQANPQTP